MNVIPTKLHEVLIIEPRTFHDPRGYFLETWNRPRYEAFGLPSHLVQDNVSFSRQGVLRGLHFQNPHAQGKLVFAASGEIFDVAVDVRRGSPTYRQWVGVVLSSENNRQLYIPEGFAHGFCVLSETALVTYKCTEVYKPEGDASILWDDPDIGIDWPIKNPILSDKDRLAPTLATMATDRVPTYSPPTRSLSA